MTPIALAISSEVLNTVCLVRYSKCRYIYINEMDKAIVSIRSMTKHNK